ncbi:hypothetical protein Rhe02_74570 [Rhizocola hellebori]|uniref:Uncharacterized protein n=1 Tax=Rhizocola hellebori TaxID=1392758 RepID=A0A8J3QEJ4_9ACTN|nr:hypothetical protein Rhe02_74570 [Rhizocola hellebori]
MPALLAVLAGTCVGLSHVSGNSRVRSLESVHEVLAVTQGTRTGTVVIYVLEHGQEAQWLIDDSGEALGREAGDTGLDVTASTTGCAGQTCYRVAKTAMRVEASQDGGATYQVAWEVSGEDYQVLLEGYPDVGDPAEHLASKYVVVHQAATGHVVFVANGRDGLLYRNVKGEWRRLGSPASGEGCCYYVPPLRLASDPQPGLSIYAIGLAVGAILVAGVVTMAARRRWRFTAVVAVVVLAALAGYGAKLAANFPDVGMFPGQLYGLGIFSVIFVSGIALTIWIVGEHRSVSPPSSL